jgi:DNA-binding NarL/FixJ family response regulator
MPKKCPNLLTDREKEVLKNFCFTAQEISENLHITKNTVKMHTDNIFSKLSCKSKAEALFIAIKQDLIELNDVRTKEL